MAAMAAFLDFRSNRFQPFLIYRLPRCCLSSFKPIGFSVQEKKFKIYFQDGFLIWNIRLFVSYKSPQSQYFLSILESIDFSVKEKKLKIDFYDGPSSGHLGFPIGTILASFIYKKGKRKVQGVPNHEQKGKIKDQGVSQSQTAALPRPQEEEETDKYKQAQIEQTYEKH